MVEGLKLMGRIFLAAGASRVMPATYAWHELRTERQLERLDDYVRDHADLLLTTAHPQGGNPVGEPREGGVVGADFRVHDFANLYVADASVFPTSVAVNPQLTVMGLAQYAARRITGMAPRILSEAALPPGSVRGAQPRRAAAGSAASPAARSRRACASRSAATRSWWYGLDRLSAWPITSRRRMPKRACSQRVRRSEAAAGRRGRSRRRPRRPRARSRSPCR